MKRSMLWTLSLLALFASSFIATWQHEEVLETKKEDERMGYEELPCDTCVHVEETEAVNEQDNTIYNVSLIKDGKVVEVLEALSGRADTQGLDRNVANEGAPSPSGEYVILPETVGYHDETGGVFLPYEPLFQTERSFLGFHQDPSWGKDNGEDGTEGCLAVKTLEEYRNLLNFIEDNQVTQLIIK